MKLATYQDGSRDGQLVLVSRDLRHAHYATGIAPHLQAVLDDWAFLSPQLQDLFEQLNAGQTRHAFDFEPQRCMAPLPRAHAWLSGKAYPSHAHLLHRAWPERWARPADADAGLSLRWSDGLLGPHAPVLLSSELVAADFEAELLAYTGDVRAGVSPDVALQSVRLLGLGSGIWLRQRQARQQGGALALHANSLNAMAAVVVTPDELGSAWQHGKVHLSVQCSLNGRKLGLCDAAADMAFDFGHLIAQAAHGHRLTAGTLIGTGVISQMPESSPDGLAWPLGFCSLLARQAMEQVRDGQVQTEWLKPGDSIGLEVKGRDGLSVFGAIEQHVTLSAA